jgi:hypothetical protein
MQCLQTGHSIFRGCCRVCVVFASFVGDARDKGDVNAAKRRAQLGFFFLLPLLGITAEPVDPLPEGKIELSTKEIAALNRLVQRLKQLQQSQATNASTDPEALLKLLTCPDAQKLEDMYSSSMQQRLARELKWSTVQDQVSGLGNLMTKGLHTLIGVLSGT